MRCWLSALLLLAVTGSPAGVAAATPPEPADSSATRPEEPTVLGAPPAFDLSGESADQVRVEAGSRLHRAPAARSPVLASFTAATDLPVLERSGPWARVRYRSWKGWVRLDGVEAEGEVDPAAEAPSAAWTTFRGPDPDHLRRARALLAGERRLPLGPFELLTDMADEALVGTLAGVAARLPEAFHRRYGLEALVDTGETVVLYTDDVTYQAYADQEGLAELESSGHARGGLAVLAAGERRPDEVRSLLVHELTHLLTYRALGARLPPWLAEGLAEDLAYCRAGPTGELELGSLDGWRSMRQEMVVDARGRPRSVIVRSRGGPELALAGLRARWARADRPSFEDLVDMPRLDFSVPERRPIHYPMSAFLVRYLLAGDERAGRFRGFLAAVARGAEGDGEDLLTHLGVGWADLETDFSDWLSNLR